MEDGVATEWGLGVEDTPVARAHGIPTEADLHGEIEQRTLVQHMVCWREQMKSSDAFMEWLRKLAAQWHSVYDEYQASDRAAAGAASSSSSAASVSWWHRLQSLLDARYSAADSPWRGQAACSERDAALFLNGLCKLPSMSLRHCMDNVAEELNQTSEAAIRKAATASSSSSSSKRNPKSAAPQFLKASPQQYSIVNLPLTHCRLLVEGFSGTGKTLCALSRARDLADCLVGSSDRVLFLCSTLALCEFLRCNFPHPTDRIQFEVVQNVHKLKSTANVAHIIVDEGQDFKLFQLQHLEALLEKRPDGVFWIFRDLLQAYFEPAVNVDQIGPTWKGVGDAVLRLTFILRHSAQIFDFVSKSINRRCIEDPNSVKVEISKLRHSVPVVSHYVDLVPDQSKEDFDSKFLDEVRKQFADMLAAHLRPEDLHLALPPVTFASNWDRRTPVVPLAVLTSYTNDKQTNKDFNLRISRLLAEQLAAMSLLNQFEVVNAQDYYSRVRIGGTTETLMFDSLGALPVTKTLIVCDSFKKFAGLEARAVLAVDPFEPAQPDNANSEASSQKQSQHASATSQPQYLYTGVSRAVSRLVAVLHPKHKRLLEEAPVPEKLAAKPKDGVDEEEGFDLFGEE